MAEVKSAKYPVYMIRYEDLIIDKQSTLEGIMKFNLNLTDIEDTNAQRRVAEICKLGNQAGIPYLLKATSGKLNAHAHMYT